MLWEVHLGNSQNQNTKREEWKKKYPSAEVLMCATEMNIATFFFDSLLLFAVEALLLVYFMFAVDFFFLYCFTLKML